MGFAQFIVGDTTSGLNQGTFFGGISPCVSLGGSNTQDSEAGSNFNSLGLQVSADYFVADNLSVGASLGAFRNGSSSSQGTFESGTTNAHTDVGLNANFYPPNCFCDGESNDARFRPFVGVNALLRSGRFTSSSDNSEFVQGFRDIKGSLSAGVLVNLKDDYFMGIEADVLSVTNGRSFDPDTGNDFSQNTNFNFGLNKSLWSVNFVRKF